MFRYRTFAGGTPVRSGPCPPKMIQTAILLEGMRFHARHGVHAEEARTGHWFRVDVRVELPEGRYGIADRLAHTLDYEQVYRICAEVMGQRADLLETLAGRILTGIGRLQTDCGTVTVRVAKEAPPFSGPCERVAVELRARPDEWSGTEEF
jgi:7,8-dihydroneopterin aldolase/epimerase/oxygenase